MNYHAPMIRAQRRGRRGLGLTTAVGVAGIAFVLGGCGSPSGSPAITTSTTGSGGSTGGSAGSSATTKPGGGAPTSKGTVAPPSTTTIPYSAAKNARKDVTTSGSCTMVGGQWVLNGEIKNSATVGRTYQVVVDFVTVPGNTVLNTQVVTTASVKPGASLAWSAKSAPGLNHVSCIIRQVQAPAP